MKWVVSVIVFATFVFVANASHCQNLSEEYKPKPLNVTVRGRPTPVSLYWGSGPARAASALLLVVLRYVLGYQNVRLRQGPLQLTELSNKLHHRPSFRYEELVLSLSTAWEPEPPPKWLPNHRECSGLAGPRLEEYGASSIPVRRRLHFYLGQRYHRACRKNSTHWRFFSDPHLLRLCGFIDLNGGSDLATVYGVEINDSTMFELQTRANASNLPLRHKELDRASLFRMLRTSDASFLFIDFDMWSRVSDVSAVQLPPCTPATPFGTCQQELDTSISMRVADVYLLKEFAPKLFEAAHNYKPLSSTAKQLLESESNGMDIEEAACLWARGHVPLIKQWSRQYNPQKKEYQINAIHCRDDPDLKKLSSFYGVLGDRLQTQIKTFQLGFKRYIANCSDINFIKNKLDGEMSYEYRQRLLGVIVGNMKDMSKVTKTLSRSDVPVMLYDSTDADVDATTAVWRTVGHSLHIALALAHFMHNMGWTRLAVISDQSDTAKSLFKHLSSDESLILRDYPVHNNLSLIDANQVLLRLKKDDARIILLNTNYEDAATILMAGVNLKMNITTDFEWILRDWRPDERFRNNMRHYAISFWCRHSSDVIGNDDWRDIFGQMDEWKQWPARFASIIDAVLTLIKAYESVFVKYPEARDDLHTETVLQYLENRLIESPLEGAIQNLTFKRHSVDETFVFVDMWYGDERELFARMRVSASARTVNVEMQKPFSCEVQLRDGASTCLVISGDPYLPTCRTTITVSVATVVLLVGALILGYYTRILFKKVAVPKVINMKRNLNILSTHIVERSAIEFRHELGVSKLGRVHLAVLRGPRSLPRVVAAKEIKDGKDRANVLREACTLVTLDHEHIIRFVGVCVDNKPPLILLGVAFFGDLLQYLQARRHLIEVTTSKSEGQLGKTSEEATYVSAEALTRLARQAASALAYLKRNGVVHRDLRASNCLVDANRSIKLADFRMARFCEVTGIHDPNEGDWQRRPSAVPWMAPESLEHHLFSPASDVWAFGILVLELVTLGDRPFGEMTPEKVKEHVCAHKKPPLPRGVSSQTSDFVKDCWHYDPLERTTAAKIVQLLTERSNILRPTVIGHHERLDSADSGFDDSPMSVLLP
ncbi:uncharacterized protein LOC142978946 [Anticarsia gemmatalis]|uniref:uncharacterized protein LOC142978946 n=1 Tax=Anticarsia gemmatalis TaxID=129554 RepID=UPI003F76B1AC